MTKDNYQIKSYKRKNGQVVKSHKRKIQFSTFEKGYNKAKQEYEKQLYDIEKLDRLNKAQLVINIKKKEKEIKDFEKILKEIGERLFKRLRIYDICIDKDDKNRFYLREHELKRIIYEEMETNGNK